MVETGWATTATMISEGIPQFFFSVETGWATTATLISEGIVWESSRNGWNWFSNHCNPDFRRYTPIFFLVDPRMLGQALQTDNSKRITSLNTQSWFIYQSNLHFYRCILILFLEMDIQDQPHHPPPPPTGTLLLGDGLLIQCSPSLLAQGMGGEGGI